MAGSTWLVSYPKSGNTWMRLFLANLASSSPEPLALSTMGMYPISSGRHFFYEMTGIHASELTEDELMALRSEAFTLFSTRLTKDLIFKVHEVNSVLEDGTLLFTADATARVLYVIRNPLDICESVAIHFGHRNLDKAIEQMRDNELVVSDSSDRCASQLPQLLTSWSNHVNTWTGVDIGPRLVVRYEDMLASPMDTFMEVARFMGLNDDADAVSRAIRHSSFDELRAQEDEHGFQEAPPGDDHFFRKGRAGAWREVLSEAQVRQIIHDHRETMHRFGYVDSAGRPIEP